MKKIRMFLKENKVFIIILVVTAIIFNFPLSYYISAPGGIIDVENRITLNGKLIDKEGSLNMLYVTEYNGTIGSVLLAKVLNNWDVKKIETKQIDDESEEEISIRSKLLLNESIQNASFVAYNHAGKKISVSSKENIVLATTSLHTDGLLSGDIIKTVDGIPIDNNNDLKKIINSRNIGEKLIFLIERNNSEQEINVEIKEAPNGEKIIGIIFYTKYDYDLDPKIDIKFKNTESGSSGGLMMALSIYNAISEDDIIKGRDIAGTGTISIDGTVGSIDGIKYKIIGAYKNKMDVVLVPKGNYKEAKKINKENNYNLKLISIETFDDAITYLKNN